MNGQGDGPSHACIGTLTAPSPRMSEDPKGIHAAANEQQAIGRVHRPGQTKDVHVHRLLLHGPTGQRTIDHRIFDRNTDRNVILQATNT